MWDDPPVRHRADQPGEEYPDVRRFHDWSDVEGQRDRPAIPREAETPPAPLLRLVVPEETTADEIAAPEPIEAVSEPPADPFAAFDRRGWWTNRTWTGSRWAGEARWNPPRRLGLLDGARLLQQRLMQRNHDNDDRPPWER